MTPTQDSANAEAGLALVASSGLPDTAPVVALARALVDGTADDEALVEAWDQWNSIVASSNQHAGIAWLCMGGVDGLARARVAAESLTLDGRMSCLSDNLTQLNRITRARMETALQVAADRGIERAGRIATRNITNPALKAKLRAEPPAQALATVAAAGLFAAIEQSVMTVIQATVDDAVTAAAPIVIAAQAETEALIGDAFYTIPEPGTRWTDARNEASSLLAAQFALWLVGRADPSPTNDPDTIDPGKVPPTLAADTLDVAGGVRVSGGNIELDDDGIARSSDGTAALEGVSGGPIALDLIYESLGAWAPDVTNVEDGA